MLRTASGAKNEREINKNTIISYHLNLLINQRCVAAVNTKIPIKDVTMTNSPCHIFSIPIKRSSWLNKKTIGSIPVLIQQERAALERRFLGRDRLHR